MSLDLSWLPFNNSVSSLAAHKCGIFALEKPPGIMTHPNASGLSNAGSAMLVADYSLKNECYYCRGNDNKVQEIFVLNRLDSPTSGIVLCSLSKNIAQSVKRAFIEDNVHKVYYALVAGIAPQKAIWKDYLIREKTKDASLKVKIALHSKLRGAQYAETEVSREATFSFYTGSQKQDFSLLRLCPHTGRTHQLRVQCAARNFPILGDKTYGNTEINNLFKKKFNSAEKNRLFLHAAETSLDFLCAKERIHFSVSSPLPKCFKDALLLNEKTSLKQSENGLQRFRIRLNK